MAELIVVDASVLIAWLDDHDTHHREAIDALASVAQFIVHPLTLAEVLVHPTRSGRDADVMTRLDAIGMIVSTRHLDPIDLARTRASTGLKMPHCVALSCARSHGVGLATFDDALRRVADA